MEICMDNPTPALPQDTPDPLSSQPGAGSPLIPEVQQESIKPENTPANDAVNLGKKLAFFHGRRRIEFLLGGIFLICDILCLILAFLNAGNHNTGGKPVTFGPAEFSFLLGIVVVIGLGIWAIVFYYQTLANSFTFFEQGFTYVDKRKDYEHSWDEIKELYYRATMHYTNGIYTGTEYKFNLVFHDGNKLKLGTNLLGKFNSGLDKLGSMILEKISEMLLPGCEQALESGRKVQFGFRLAIDREKLYENGRSINLSDVKQIVINQGYVRIATTTSPNWAIIKISEIANVVVFLQLARKFTSVTP